MRLYIIAFISFSFVYIDAVAQKIASTAEATTSAYLSSLLQQKNTTALTTFFSQMPKGGDLHHHYAGSIFVEDFLEVAIKKNLFFDTLSFTFKENASNAIPAVQVKENHSLFGKILSKWSIWHYDKSDNYITPSYDHFFATFLHFSPNVLDEFIQHLFILKGRAKRENVQYIETMLIAAPPIPTVALETDKLTEDLEKANIIKDDDRVHKILQHIFTQVVNNTTNEHAIKQYLGQQHDFFKYLVDNVDDKEFNIRFQLYLFRNTQAHFHSFATLLANFMIANHSPEYVVGVNIVGPEHRISAQRNYWLHMQMFRFLKEKFPHVKTAIHAGEMSSGLVKPEELSFHIQDALYIAKADRIGHGIDIAHEYNALDILDFMAKNKKAIEINLTSNDFILNVQGDAHPIILYEKSGVPIVISTDDAGVLRTNLTEQFVLLASTYTLGYEKIKQFVLNSIRYAFMDDKLKEKQLGILLSKFQDFEHAIAAKSKK